MKKLIVLALLLPTLVYASNCESTYDSDGELERIKCPHIETTLFKGTINQREVLWALPKKLPPLRGFPVVILSQGSWFPIEFERPAYLPFGAIHEVGLIQKLLDSGYAVIAPRATLNLGWITNLPRREYEKTADYKVLNEVINRIKTLRFGPLNRNRIYATGISSGGYNTSRLTITFPNTFKAIAIQSGSYATCLGILCNLPDELPTNHAPTLFVHGKKDIAVPLFTAQKYHELLVDHGIESEIYVDQELGHGWSKDSPRVIVDWFNRHP